VTFTAVILEGQHTKALRVLKISIPLLWAAHLLFLSSYKKVIEKEKIHKFGSKEEQQTMTRAVAEEPAP
jgi:hypothetical protein